MRRRPWIPLDVQAMNIDLMSISTTRSTDPRASVRSMFATKYVCVWCR